MKKCRSDQQYVPIWPSAEMTWHCGDHRNVLSFLGAQMQNLFQLKIHLIYICLKWLNLKFRCFLEIRNFAQDVRLLKPTAAKFLFLISLTSYLILLFLAVLRSKKALLVIFRRSLILWNFVFFAEIFQTIAIFP